MLHKTQGICVGCSIKCPSGKEKAHLLSCKDTLQLLQSAGKLEKGYLVRISWAEQPHTYWIVVAVPRSLTLDDLDRFLRELWLECCGHLSEFKIGGQRFISHTESGYPSQVMKKPLGPFLSPGLEFKYRYDLGSSTDLVGHVLEELEACPNKKVTLLMQNERPAYVCEICKKKAQIICSFCTETVCEKCSKRHSCAEKEDDTYMLMPIVNSPRTGVCGYDGTL